MARELLRLTHRGEIVAIHGTLGGFQMRSLGKVALRLTGGALFVAGATLGFTSAASATVCTSPDYTCANGAETYPGTYVGTIGTASGNVDEIGNITEYSDGNGGAFADSGSNPSIYEFYWAGGTLDVTEEREGGTQNLNIALQSLASKTATSPSSTLGSADIPGGVDSTFTTVYDANLAAGYYALDNYITTVVSDPEYQVDFSIPASVPEPLTLSIFGAGLAGAFAVRRRKLTKTA